MSSRPHLRRFRSAYAVSAKSVLLGAAILFGCTGNPSSREDPPRAAVGVASLTTQAELDDVQAYYWAKAVTYSSPQNVAQAGAVVKSDASSTDLIAHEGTYTEMFAKLGITSDAEIQVRLTEPGAAGVPVNDVVAKVDALYGEHCGGLGCKRMYVWYWQLNDCSDPSQGGQWSMFFGGDVTASTLGFVGYRDPADGLYWVSLRRQRSDAVCTTHLRLRYQSNGAVPGGPSSKVYLVGGMYRPTEYLTEQAPPESCEMASTVSHVGAPVNTYTGGESWQTTDLSVSTAAGPMQVSRSYHSNSAQGGVFGPKWSSSLELSVAAGATDSAGSDIVAQAGPSLPVIRSWTGVLHRYVPSGRADCSFVPPRGSRLSLKCLPGGGYELQQGCGGQRYHFDAQGKLLQQLDLEGRTIRYGYDSAGRVARLTSPSGNRFIALSYDSSGRLVQANDHTGRTVRYGYDATGMLSSITDVRGFATTYRYDDAGRLVAVSNALGESITNGYEGDRVVVQRLGVTSSNPNGLMTTTFSYSTEGTVVTDGVGRSLRYRYDGRGRLLSVENALGQRTTRTYDVNNNVASITDGLGRRTTQKNTRCGKPTEVRRTLGDRTLIARFSYNGYGGLKQVIDTLGRTTTYRYEDTTKPWRLSRITRPDGTTSPPLNYNAQGELASLRDALGNVTTFGYDTSNEHTLIQVTLPSLDGSASVQRFQFDNLGRIVRETDPLGVQVASTTYDANDAVLSVTNALGQSVGQSYDAAGRLVEQTSPLSGAMRYSYDAAGRVVAITLGVGTPQQATTTFAYDGGGKLMQHTDSTGIVTQYRYDAVGRQVAVVAAAQGGLPERAVTQSYDAAGQVVSVADPVSGTTRFSYDTLGRRISVTNALNQTTHYSYNDAGELLSVTDAKGQVTQYAYNALGLLTLVQDAEGGVTRYRYTALGQLESLTDPEGRTRRFEYDAHGHAVALFEGGSSHALWEKSYNVAGQLARHTDGDGRALNYSYDSLGRLTRLDAPGSSDDVTYSYNSLGLLSQLVNSAGRTSYNYDGLGQLLQVDSQYPQLQSVRYGYDLAGRRTSITYPGGGILQYGYDAQGRLASVTANGGLNAQLSSTYAYDAAGHLAEARSASGAWRTLYTYDTMGRPTEKRITAGANQTPYVVFAQRYDAASNVLSENVAFSGEPARQMSYAYDRLNRLVGRDTLQGTTRIDYEQFSYDKSGNRRSYDSLNRAESYAYDATNRLITWAQKRLDQGPVSVTKTRRLRYDGSGNLLSDGERTFRYNALRQLMEHNVTGIYPNFEDDARTYRYDGQGLLRSESATRESYAAVWDVGSMLPQRLMQGTQQLVYGLDGLIGSSQGTAGRLAVTDARGSVLREVTASLPPGSAPLTNHRYEAFGATQSNEAQSFIGFTGELQDPHGLVYLRARHYDTQTGRFLTHDPFAGTPGQPQTLNPYPYAANNPATYTDPSGNIPLWFAVPLFGAALGAAGGFVAGYSTCNGDWQCVGASMLFGAAGGFFGALSGTGVVGGLIAPLLGAAAFGALQGANSQYWANQHAGSSCTSSSQTLLEAAAWGAFTGAATFGIGYGIGRFAPLAFGGITGYSDDLAFGAGGGAGGLPPRLRNANEPIDVIKINLDNPDPDEVAAFLALSLRLRTQYAASRLLHGRQFLWDLPSNTVVTGRNVSHVHPYLQSYFGRGWTTHENVLGGYWSGESPRIFLNSKSVYYSDWVWDEANAKFFVESFGRALGVNIYARLGATVYEFNLPLK